MNKAAYFNRTRTSPYDNLDLNRIFPGDKDGSQSMQLAHAIWQETRAADYIIDLTEMLHGLLFVLHHEPQL